MRAHTSWPFGPGAPVVPWGPGGPGGPSSPAGPRTPARPWEGGGSLRFNQLTTDLQTKIEVTTDRLTPCPRAPGAPSVPSAPCSKIPAHN